MVTEILLTFKEGYYEMLRLIFHERLKKRIDKMETINDPQSFEEPLNQYKALYQKLDDIHERIKFSLNLIKFFYFWGL
jgi:hypothetical protein